MALPCDQRSERPQYPENPGRVTSSTGRTADWMVRWIPIKAYTLCLNRHAARPMVSPGSKSDNVRRTPPSIPMTLHPDWLSQFLEVVTVTGQLEVRCAYGAPWVVAYEQSRPTEIPYHVVLRGRAILEDPEDPEDGTATELHAGSIALLTHGCAHVLHDGGGRPPGPASYRETGGFLVSENGGSGEHLDMLCGRFFIAPPHDRLIRHYLPTKLIVRAADSDAVPDRPMASARLVGLVDLMRAESMDAMLGGYMMLNALSAALFTLALRAASEADHAPRGLLALASEPRLAPAISAMLQDPARAWTLPALASLCNMSRATFMRQFQSKVGRSAIDMLTDMRMSAAANELRKPTATVEAVSSLVGYQSVSAFRRAFTTWMTMTPGEWRRSALAAADGALQPEASTP
jgi:AraC family transcriptional activator of mtrCDE